ncbi:MAG: histidine kinase dimerization/phospho-acceptor domain-containing protein [Geminicoccaceae bacterium]
MSKDRPHPPPTLALNTKVEEDFVAPLTSLRGALEILRDFEDLSDDERHRFLETALRGCTRLEQSVEDLAKTVYAAGQQAQQPPSAGPVQDGYPAYAARVHVLGEMDTIEIDFSDFAFSSSEIVNDFYDAIERIIDETGRDWYLVVNYSDCSIWPEAWVAFAHRGKRVNVTHSLGTVRYASRDDAEGGGQADFRSDSYDPNLFDTREAAFAKIEEMKSAKTA